MKRPIDLEKAAEAEVVGALAVGHSPIHRQGKSEQSPLTRGQRRVLSDLASSLVRIARESGAEGKRIAVGSVSFEWREDGAEEILSIRKAIGA